MIFMIILMQLHLAMSCIEYQNQIFIMQPTTKNVRPVKWLISYFCRSSVSNVIEHRSKGIKELKYGYQTYIMYVYIVHYGIIFKKHCAPL